MNCEDTQALLDGYTDGELDLVNHLQIEQHLDGCADCKLAYKNSMALKSALKDDSLYFRASSDLRERIQASLWSADPKATPTARWWQWRWTPVLAAAVVAAAILITMLTVFRPATSNDDLLAKEIVSAHIRSMMVGHLMDVPSSDQHTVKPWFDGKLDFSPPVIDLGTEEFMLVGGRLDYAGSRPVAALVYQRRQHFINLFVFPSADNSYVGSKVSVRQGYNLIYWSRSGMTFWAVSDLNLSELRDFAQAIQDHV